MTSFRREQTTTLTPQRAWEVVSDLTGPGHWGRAVRTFRPVAEPGKFRAGTRLLSTTWVFDEPLEAEVLVVRFEVGATRSRLVLHDDSAIGVATESLQVVGTDDRGTVVEHQVTVDSGVDEAAMGMWLSIFGRLCHDGLRDALEASGA